MWKWRCNVLRIWQCLSFPNATWTILARKLHSSNIPQETYSILASREWKEPCRDERRNEEQCVHCSCSANPYAWARGGTLEPRVCWHWACHTCLREKCRFQHTFEVPALWKRRTLDRPPMIFHPNISICPNCFLGVARRGMYAWNGRHLAHWRSNQETVHFLSARDHFQHLGCILNKGRVSRGVGQKGIFLLLVWMLPRIGFLLEFQTLTGLLPNCGGRPKKALKIGQIYIRLERQFAKWYLFHSPTDGGGGGGSKAVAVEMVSQKR